MILIFPAPTPTITKSGLVLSATATYVSYTWVRNAGEIVGSSATFTVSKNGVYKLRVKDANGCDGESNPIEINENGLSIDAIALEANQIKIYPNPTDGKVFIESPIALNIEVKDVTGKIVLPATEAKEIDLSKYADGIYLFVIRDKDQLIKQQRVTKTSK